jgi:hypothetical protein
MQVLFKKFVFINVQNLIKKTWEQLWIKIAILFLETYVIVEQLEEWRLTGKTEVLGENLP